mmetsp:Transcript_27500/g.57387  ORF Transcript_27500/g.57387 Transcript_27500/m.57387 type:complete len:370 (+) Transcript_27500:112-1221(+)
MIAAINGEAVFPALADLALDETVKRFLSGKEFSYSFFQALRPEIASAFYARLPLPTNENLETIASFVENDDYWKRACNSKGHRGEAHGLSHKRMFFEIQFEDILKAIEKEGQEAIADKMRSIIDYIYTVKLRGPRGQFPLDIVCKKLPNLTNINLKHASCLDFKETIPKAIASSPLLTSLVLTESQISDDDVALMVANLADLSTLLHLDLSHNKISSHGAKTIAEKLIASSGSILSCLNLSGNRISSEGASVLGKTIAADESLLSLTLRLNNIGDEGGKDLFEGIAQNTTLWHLNMSANKLGSDSAATLHQVLETKSQDCALESIILTSNAFSEEELKCLSHCQICFIDVRTSHGPAKNNGIVASEMPS